MQQSDSARGDLRPVMESLGHAGSIAAMEESRRAALIARDSRSLDRLLHADFVYVHSSGRIEGKDAYIAAVLSGKNTFLGFASREVSTDVVGDVALYRAVLDVKSRMDGIEAIKIFRSLGVWRVSGGEWSLFYWQNTMMKNAAAP